jgi:probable HAF family extracellular repeat protein
MRTVVSLLLSLVATFHVHAQVTITPVAPTSADVIIVHVSLGSYQVRTQSHSVSGSTVTVTIVNDGPNFGPNPPGTAVEPIGPLPAGNYTFVIFVLPGSAPIATIPVAVSAAPGGLTKPTYTATRLGTLGGNGSGANAINASGEVTGFSYVTKWTPPNPDPHTQWHAFVYSGDIMRDLGTFGGSFSSGSAINASGQVAGFASLNNLPYPFAAQHAFFYSNGVLTDLGTLGGANSRGQGINASGQVAGSSELIDAAGNPTAHAFLYSNGVMTDLGTMGGRDSSGSAVNASGQVTGIVTLPDSPTLGTVQHAFLYTNGAMHDLNTLAGAGAGGLTLTFGTAINDSGQITGQAWTGDATHAFLYSGATTKDLGTLGGDSSFGFGINGSGQVVGGSNVVGNGQHAFLYSDGIMYDLNDLVSGLAGTLLTNATAINDTGQIVANGCSQSLICQSFRLDPSPTASVVVKVAAVEFHYPVFDHYFITAGPSEISALDGGTFPGWVRTGETFNVYSSPSVGSASVCRFFSTAFAPKSSHFYTPDAGECSIVKQNGGWLLEGDAMSASVPDQAGNCTAGTQPVYRLYNNGQGAAPNHRYTTSLATRAQMIVNGWIPEGYGPLGVIMCAPL